MELAHPQSVPANVDARSTTRCVVVSPLDGEPTLLAREFAEAVLREHWRLTPIIADVVGMSIGQMLHTGLFWRLAGVLLLVRASSWHLQKQVGAGPPDR